MNRILINTLTFPRWPQDEVPSFVLDFAKALKDEGNYVHILAPHYKGAKLCEDMQGVRVYRFIYFCPKLENLSNGKAIIENLKANSLNYLLVPFFLLSNCCLFIYLNLKNNYDIVNIHWIVPFGIIGAVFKPLFRYKLVITSHGGDILDFQKLSIWKYAKPFMRFTLKYTDKLTVVSQALKSEVIRIFGLGLVNKVSIVSMGIDFRKFNSVKRAKSNTRKLVKLLFVGRLVYRKGADILIDACAQLKQDGINFQCNIIGDGPEREKLAAQIRKLELESYVSLVGYVQHNQILIYQQDAFCFVGPSRSEGLGLVFLEAMAACLPVITTNVDGIRDIVENNKTGFLIEQDDPKALKNAIVKLIKEKDLRTEMIKKGENLARTYDWQLIASKFMQEIK